MKAGVLYAKGDIRYEEVEDPNITENDVLVKVKASGICGSDIPRVLGDAAHFYPIILGHEFSGEVVEVGKNVENVKVGDRVVGAPLLPCFECSHCQKGWYSQCKNYSFIGSRRQGSFAEYIAIPARNAVKFDESISFEQAVFFEPSTVALHGLRCADFKGGEDVLILGAGTIGIFTLQWARIMGANFICVVDIKAERLELAKEFGADVVINATDQEFIEKVNELTKGKGFGYVFETAGSVDTIRLSFEFVSNKGYVCLIGTPTKEVMFSPQLFEKINRKEFHLTGSWMSYSAPFPGIEWELTAKYFLDKRLKFSDKLIYKTFHLKDIKEAFELFKTPENVKGKVIILN
ncbi:galactitol-1-phosphate 5-dehydrogenase [Anaerocellum danielii]|uniref:Galactitol-1-phosphate 5-dehydrogenase n=1 Tax=Anaerocellum danielii TaxID=1387557 RepID=A0ABZ0U1K0_9FIRM|nr:galactitol-1-phosphate 5-dehydrogenase [Caldicellulosiruptor danielii]WPX08309.1 galactitol-1-phosphate 5-dehydrogenase [Caldicellulosiruptor danielii]